MDLKTWAFRKLTQVVLITQTVDLAPEDVVVCRGAVAKCGCFLVSGILPNTDPDLSPSSFPMIVENVGPLPIVAVDADCFWTSLVCDSRFDSSGPASVFLFLTAEPKLLL